MSEQDTIDRAQPATTEAPARPAHARKKKVAVVAVHGMGEQRPMDTLWGLVEALWLQDPEVCRYRQVYPKPDRITGSFELRRITTVQSKLPGNKRVDFFEFYWAHMMRANSIGSVLSAVKTLLWRHPGRVPRRLVPVWLFGCVAAIAIAGLYAWAVVTAARWSGVETGEWVLGAGALAAAVLFALRTAAQRWIGPVAGDAARYLSPDPGNVAERQAIRTAAVDLLEKLHASDDYDRIVVVGHSLGTVIAYDALNFAWSRIDHEEITKAQAASPSAMAALADLERAGVALQFAGAADAGALRIAYRTGQRRYLNELAGLKRKDGSALWLVSDFVSTASPLSKADVLMARDFPGWERRRRLRDVPTCPPQLEKLNPARFSFPPRDNVRAPHHAAVFAPTVWTNVYFETALVVLGDVIAGPVRGLFGPGVLDVRIPRGGALIRHLDYWKDPKAKPARAWIKALRRAVNLRQADEASLWGAQADADEVRAERL